MKSHTHQGGTLTALFLETFRLNGRLLAVGDALVADIGLTSARWQVLGAVAMAGAPRTVADLGRDMGLTRQAVLRVVTDLARAGLLQLRANPRHRRSRLVTLTDEGDRAYRAAMARQVPWANDLARDIPTAALETARAVLARLRQRFENRDHQGANHAQEHA